MDGRQWFDEYGWHYQAPRAADKLSLALLEDLSNLLVTHGYPPLRGVALDQICRASCTSNTGADTRSPVADEAASTAPAAPTYLDTVVWLEVGAVGGGQGGQRGGRQGQVYLARSW